MNVLIIGTGNMGRGIASRLVSGNNAVTLYNPTQEKAEALAAELNTVLSAGANVRAAGSLEEALPQNEVVVLASWYPVNLNLAQELGTKLAGKVVIDISNPLNETYSGLSTEPGTSAAETIQAVLPADVKLVKAFNTTFAGTLVEGQVNGQPLDVLIAGDDGAAKATVATLVQSGGLNPIDVGVLERAQQLEGLGLLGITLQSQLNTGFMTAWKLLVPEQA
jgi:NADPH-dependent F420 reductase